MNEHLAQRIARRIASLQGRDLDQDELDTLMAVPRFDDREGWQRFVDIDMQIIWYRLDRTTQLAIYLTALKAHYENLAKSNVPNGPVYHGQISTTGKTN